MRLFSNENNERHPVIIFCKILFAAFAAVISLMPMAASADEGPAKDASYNTPYGIYLRPFIETSWYLTSADHAVRIIGE